MHTLRVFNGLVWHHIYSLSLGEESKQRLLKISMEPGPQESETAARVQMCTKWSEGSTRLTWVTPGLTPRTPRSWALPQTHRLKSMTIWEATTLRVASSRWPVQRVASWPMTSTNPTRTVPAPATTENTAGWIRSSTVTEQDFVLSEYLWQKTLWVLNVLRHFKEFSRKSRIDFFCPGKWAPRWQTAVRLSSYNQLSIISDLVSYGRQQ